MVSGCIAGALSRDASTWPRKADDAHTLAVTARQLRWLIDGLNWHNAVAHQPMAPRVMR